MAANPPASIVFDWPANYDGSRSYLFPNGGKPVPDYIVPQSNAVESIGISFQFVNAHEDDQCNTWAAHRKAKPGLAWSYVFGVHGGQAPYYYEVSGPAGITIGAAEYIDDGTGTGRLIPDPERAKIRWQSPTAGSHVITVTARDNKERVITRTWTLVVSDAGHVFIDSALGNDSTGDGSMASPFATDFPLHQGSSVNTDYSGYHVWIAGNVPLSGMTDANNNYKIGDGPPAVLKGWPGKVGQITLTDQKFVISGNDAYIADLEINHSTTGWTTSDRHIFYVSGVAHRMAIVDFKNSYYTTGPTTGANPAVLYMSMTDRNDILLKNWEVTGTSSTIINNYNVFNGLYDGIRAHDVNLVNDDASSQQQALRMKSRHYGVTMRNCEMWENITYTGIQAAAGIHGSHDDTNIDFCYNRFSHPGNVTARSGALYMWSGTNNVEPRANIHVYRNAIDSVHWEGGGKNITNEVWEKNVMAPAQIDAAAVTNIDNLQAGTYLDAQLYLDASNTQYRGTHGPEVFDA